MIKKIILFIFIFFVTACSEYDINNLAIINEITIDYNGSYKVYIKVLDDSENNYKLYKEDCDTLNECFYKINNKLNKKLYLAHLELLALSDNLTKTNYDEIFNFFINQESSRNTFSTIVINDIDKSFFDLDSKDIENSLNLSIATNGIVEDKTFDNIIRDILDYEISFVPFFDVKEKEFTNYYVIYQNNKPLSTDESIIMNFLFNSIKELTLLIRGSSYKLNNCYTTNSFDNNVLTFYINCRYEGSDDSKEEIEKYLQSSFKKVHDSNNNYFLYLAKKYNKGKIDDVVLSSNIKLTKAKSGDYFE